MQTALLSGNESQKKSHIISVKKSFKNVNQLSDINENTIESLKVAIAKKEFSNFRHSSQSDYMAREKI